jgi:hypothetical protein
MSAEDKEKVRKNAVGALKYKFAFMDYAKLVNAGSSETSEFGSMILNQQVTIDGFSEWCEQYDVTGILQIPCVSDFSDVDVVANAPRVNLLKDYRRFSETHVRAFQAFVNRYLSDADVESSNWIKQKLTNSVETQLLIQVKQRFDKVAEIEQGGITLWKLLVDTLYANSYENKTLIVDFLTKQRLGSTPGHDVSVAATCFVAAARSLEPCDLPSTLVQDFLRCMSDCPVEDFTDLVRAFKGAIGIQDTSAVDPLVQLDIISGKLTAKYNALLKKKEWIVQKNSVFRIVPVPKDGSRMPPLKPGQELRDPDPSWQAWFDRQICGECGKNHPTKHHDDVGVRNRKVIFTPPTSTSKSSRPLSRPQFNRNRPPFNRGNPSNNPTSSNTRRPIRFRPGGKKAMEKAVHKAWLEFVEDGDHDMMAHLADEVADDTEPEMFANVAEGDEDDGNDGNDDAEEYGEESIFKALAVAGLDSLNWQAA